MPHFAIGGFDDDATGQVVTETNASGAPTSRSPVIQKGRVYRERLGLAKMQQVGYRHVGGICRARVGNSHRKHSSLFFYHWEGASGEGSYTLQCFAIELSNLGGPEERGKVDARLDPSCISYFAVAIHVYCRGRCTAH